MKSSGSSGVKHCMKTSEWLMVLLAAILLHIILFSLFKPLPHTISESSMDNRFTLFLEEQKLRLHRQDPYGLYYWLRFTDPEQLLKPNYVAGFSMFVGRNDFSIPSPNAIPQDLFEASARYRIPDAAAPSKRDLSVFTAGPNTPIVSHAVGNSPANRTTIQYPLWIDEQDRSSSGLFLADEKSRRILNRQHSSKPTILRLTFGKDLIPRVELIQSCGNRELDMLAERQLKMRKENFSSDSLQTKYFKVIWQEPNLHAIIKEKQQ